MQIFSGRNLPATSDIEALVNSESSMNNPITQSKNPSALGESLTSLSFQSLIWTSLCAAIVASGISGLAIRFVVNDSAVAENTWLTFGLIACLIVPFLVFASVGGWLADRNRNRSTHLLCRVLETAAIVTVTMSLVGHSLPLLIGGLVLLGMHLTFFLPTVSRSLSLMTDSKSVTWANALLILWVVVGAVIGVAAVSFLDKSFQNAWPIGGGLIVVSIVGGALSLFANPGNLANNSKRRGNSFPVTLIGPTFGNLRQLLKNRSLLFVAMGVCFFWLVITLVSLTIPAYASENVATFQNALPLIVCWLVGFAMGVLLAAVLSSERIELGLAPWGAIFFAVLAIVLSFTTINADSFNAESINAATINNDAAVQQFDSASIFPCTLIFLLGASCACFYLPLVSHVQHKSLEDSRGQTLSTVNGLGAFAVLLGAALFIALRGSLLPSGQNGIAAQRIYLILGAATLPFACYLAYRIYLAMTRVLAFWILRIFYRVRINGYENIPENGGAVLIGNHSTWLDGALWLILIPRRLRMIAFAGNFKNKLMSFLANYCKVILITSGPKSIHRGLQEARKGLGRGEVVGLFPEGLLSKTGQVQTFKPGLMRILDKMPVPIVPVYLDEMWGSIFTYSGGKSLWKWPNSFRRPMTLNIGKPLFRPDNINEIRQSVMNLSADSAQQRQGPFVAPAAKFIESCKKRKFKFKLADSTGAELTGGSLLMRTVILKRLLSKHVLDANERHVGILIPPSTGAVIVNTALALDKRVAVNLNYTVSSEIMNQCIKQAGIKHVLTSRKVMEKFDFDIDAEVIYLDDLKDKLALSDKIAGAMAAYATPGFMLKSIYGLNEIQPDDLLTVIFTSGSTGVPKGVMLSQLNIASNVVAMDQVVHLKKTDNVLGILPFFHSFGYMATLWGAMYHNIGAAYHFSPLDAVQVGKLSQKYKISLLLSTPTFLRGYLRKCKPEQFETLDVVVTGAEKLPTELADAFENKFDVRPIEGYGSTELSPLVSINVPPSRSLEKFGADCRQGSVGRPIPNVAAKILDVDTGEELDTENSGMLWIKGPNVMKGYMNRPDLTNEIIQDGWYNTGDMAKVDKEGFIHITGRLSRFSKIGGEMVPHVRIEEVLSQLIVEDDQGEQKIAVTAVPDDRKGERLIVLHTKIAKSPKELCQGLAEEGLPNLYIPSENSFIEVEELPMLGTGKIDLRGIKQMAEELAGK